MADDEDEDQDEIYIYIISIYHDDSLLASSVCSTSFPTQVTTLSSMHPLVAGRLWVICCQCWPDFSDLTWRILWLNTPPKIHMFPERGHFKSTIVFQPSFGHVGFQAGIPFQRCISSINPETNVKPSRKWMFDKAIWRENMLDDIVPQLFGGLSGLGPYSWPPNCKSRLHHWHQLSTVPKWLDPKGSMDMICKYRSCNWVVH